jgi:hypothetical protein
VSTLQPLETTATCPLCGGETRVTRGPAQAKVFAAADAPAPVGRVRRVVWHEGGEDACRVSAADFRRAEGDR